MVAALLMPTSVGKLRYAAATSFLCPFAQMEYEKQKADEQIELSREELKQ